LGFSFPGEHRLHAAKDFSSVFAARKVLRGRNFDLHFLLSAGADAESVQASSARLGIVVAKKLARRAVQRNLLKRLAREAFRNTRPRLPPYDLVLRLSKPTAARLDEIARGVLRREIEQLLNQLPACRSC
jgi:ribonuclease P protein component